MNLALTILKFFGIAISVISGVLGTLSRTHEEKTIYPIIIGGETRTERKLTRSGKVYLLFICLGGIFAVGALVGESLKKQRDDAEARSLAEQQIRQLKEALKRLDNLTPLGLIDISATYEIPTNLFWANKLLQSVAPQSARLQRLAATLSPTETPEAISLFVVPRSPYRNVSRLPLRILPDGRDVKWDTEDNRSLGVAGIKAFSNDTTVLLYYNSDESFFGLQSGEIPGATHYVHGTNVESRLGSESLTNEFWMRALKSESPRFIAMWKNTAKLLNNPDVYLEFTRRGANPDSSSPDLTISGDPGDIRTTVLSYSPHSGKLTFRSDFRSSTANGGKPQSIRSISELATATARVKSWFPFSSWGINSVDCIRQVTLGVQGSTLTLTNFHALDYRDDTWAEAGITLYSTNIASTRFVR